MCDFCTFNCIFLQFSTYSALLLLPFLKETPFLTPTRASPTALFLLSISQRLVILTTKRRRLTVDPKNVSLRNKRKIYIPRYLFNLLRRHQFAVYIILNHTK